MLFVMHCGDWPRFIAWKGWESGKGGGVEDFGCVTMNLLDPHKKIRDINFICPK